MVGSIQNLRSVQNPEMSRISHGILIIPYNIRILQPHRGLAATAQMATYLEWASKLENIMNNRYVFQENLDVHSMWTNFTRCRPEEICAVMGTDQISGFQSADTTVVPSIYGEFFVSWHFPALISWVTSSCHVHSSSPCPLPVRNMSEKKVNTLQTGYFLKVHQY
jgi:hypothetical protein